MKEFVCTYQFNGRAYGLSVFAEDEAEASRRLRAIGTTAQIDGELVMRIPNYVGFGLVARIVAFVRNMFFGGASQ